VKIDVPVFSQSRPYTCVAACLRSVLSALGSEYSEEELAEACRTEPAGARLRDAATGARSLGFEALFLVGATFETLLGWLERDVPMIVSVAADELAYGAKGGHALVVCGIEQGEVLAIDPAIGSERRLPLDTFLAAWHRRGNRALVVTR
jgi:ABC-type bacteriocin/lantibiotic exporter with double-glycine peptidase domain